MRVLIATIGSLGDLHPCLALAGELKHRGHSVTIASTEFYRTRVEALGLGFEAMRPAWTPNDSDLISQCEDLKSGPEVLFRKLILPHLHDTYNDLIVAAAAADLMIAGELVSAAPLVAEKLGLRWVSAILSPCSFFSAYDPSLLVNAPWLFHMRRAGWLVNRLALNIGILAARHWWEPVRQLRHEQGLRRDCEPLTRDKFSPDLVLALFSATLAQPQPDWPSNTVQPGFLFYDHPPGTAGCSQELEAFLSSGEAPIIFTLGSTAVSNPGNFFAESAKAARRLGRRALLVGASAESDQSSCGILAVPYAAYSDIFARAAAIVHQGGSGTIGQALRAGRPMLVVPYGWDQPDNGARIERLGVGLLLARRSYTAETAAVALQRLLVEPRFAARATAMGARVRREAGLRRACDAIESAVTLRPVG